MSNVIAMLIKLGWNPDHIDFWAAPPGGLSEVYQITNLLDTSRPFILHVIHTYNNLQLYRCNNHFDGDGIGNGVNWHHTFSYLRSLRRCREHEVQCLSAALETVLAGACWPQSRVHSAKPDCLIYPHLVRSAICRFLPLLLGLCICQQLRYRCNQQYELSV